MIGCDIEIVLVEDNPNDVELISRVLKKHHLANHLVVLKDGAEVLEFIFGEGGHVNKTHCKPKLILLDLKLPKIDGTEVLARIKSNEHTRNIPVVILTSSSEQRDLVESYGLGANSYIAKPIRFADFAKVVADVGLYWLVLNKLPDR